MKILKFGATWCPGCLVMKPRWAEIEAEIPELETAYFDFDKDTEAVRRWGVTDTLPTFIFIDKNNQEITRIHGEKSKKFLINLVNEHLDK